MNDPGVKHSQVGRRTASRRLKILVGGLIVLSLAYVVVCIGPAILSRYEWGGRPLDRCLTEPNVLNYLDGKTVFFNGSMDETKNGEGSLTLRKERIGSLTIRPGDPPAIRVRFDFEDQGRRYRIEGEFLFTSIDSPDLHYHNWGDFIAEAISDR